MSTPGLRVVWRAGARADARLQSIGRNLERFRPEVRPAVRALTARHVRLADLVLSFPALAVALAKPRARFDPVRVIPLVLAGAPLPEVAAAAGVPLWLRKLPPEAFTGPVPSLPDSPRFVRQIANRLPRAKDAAKWLEAVALAAEWAEADFAVWVAREFLRDAKHISVIAQRQLRRVALWAWYSARPQTRGYAMMERRFNPAMRMKAASTAASLWLEEIALFTELGDAPVQDMWLAPQVVDGFAFVPLDSAAKIAEEARAMQNCLRTLGYHVSHGASRFWSVRRDGRRIATLKLFRRQREPLPNIHEMAAPRNQLTTPDVWWAAQKWLRSHDLLAVDRTIRPWNSPPLGTAVWTELWRPYWIAKKRIPAWLPLRPTRAVLNAL